MVTTLSTQNSKPSMSEMADICMRCVLSGQSRPGGCMACGDGYMVARVDKFQSHSVNWKLWEEIRNLLRESRHSGEMMMLLNDRLAECGIMTCAPTAPERATVGAQSLEAYAVFRGVNPVNPVGSWAPLYFTSYMDAAAFVDILPVIPGQPYLILGVVEITAPHRT